MPASVEGRVRDLKIRRQSPITAGDSNVAVDLIDDRGRREGEGERGRASRSGHAIDFLGEPVRAFEEVHRQILRPREVYQHGILRPGGGGNPVGGGVQRQGARAIGARGELDDGALNFTQIVLLGGIVDYGEVGLDPRRVRPDVVGDAGDVDGVADAVDDGDVRGVRLPPVPGFWVEGDPAGGEAADGVPDLLLKHRVRICWRRSAADILTSRIVAGDHRANLA